jgi:hypothetical protein
MAKLAIITRRYKEPSPALAAFLEALRATLAERKVASPARRRRVSQ